MSKQPLENILVYHSGFYPLFLLFVFYLIPLLTSSEVYAPLFAQQQLQRILAFEFGVLICGFFYIGLVFTPLAMNNGRLARAICFLVAALLAWAFARAYGQSYGWSGYISFLVLMFANFSSVFLASFTSIERIQLLAEMSARTIIYLIIYLVLARVVDMPIQVEHWKGNKALIYGSLYFGILGFLEYMHIFQKSVNKIFHGFESGFAFTPRQHIRMKKGKLRAYVKKQGEPHIGWLTLLLGLLIAPWMFASMYFGYHGNELSGIAKVGLMLFLCFFLVVGLSLLYDGIRRSWHYLRSRPATLAFKKDTVTGKPWLYFKGFVPDYNPKTSQGIKIELSLEAYRFYPLTDRDMPIKYDCFLTKNLHHAEIIESTEGVNFLVDCELPKLAESVKQSLSGGVRVVWHLHINVFVKRERNKGDMGSWQIAFVLPLAEK